MQSLYDRVYDWLIEDRRDLKIKFYFESALFVILMLVFGFIAMCMPQGYILGRKGVYTMINGCGGKKTCKYYNTCGNAENCKCCKGYEKTKKSKKVR